MKELTRDQCGQIAGGDPGMALAGAPGGGAGGGGFGSVGVGGFNLGYGGFDLGSVASNIGGAAYTPGMPGMPNGWFGLSVAETIGVGTGFLGLATGIGQGIGASIAIEAAGGVSAVGGMGAASAGLLGSAALGLGSAFVVGYGIGTLAYNNIEFVRDGAQWGVGAVVTGIDEIGYALGQLGTWITGLPHNPVVEQVIP